MLRPDPTGDNRTSETNEFDCFCGSSTGHLSHHPSALCCSNSGWHDDGACAASRRNEQSSVARGSEVTTQALTTQRHTRAREPKRTCTAQDRAQPCINTPTFSLRFRPTPPTARLRTRAINLSLKEADGHIARSKVCLIERPPRR